MVDNSKTMGIVEFVKVDATAEVSILKKRSRDRRSEVWSFFTKTKVGAVEKARCNACKALLATSGITGTSHLRRHHFFTCPLRSSNGEVTPKINQVLSVVSRTRSSDKKSEVWSNFTKVVVEGVEKARCNACKSLLASSSSSGTSHLRRHRFLTCPLRSADGKQQQTLSYDESRLDVKMSSITKLDFDPELSHRELVRMLIVHNIPFSLVECQEFKSFTRSLNPDFEPYGQDAFRNFCFDIYSKKKELFKDILHDSCEHVCLTTALWTSNQDLKYLALAAYFIDNSWVMQKQILNFCLVESATSASDIATLVMNALSEWKIDSKVRSITVDNGSLDDSFIPYIQEYCRVKGSLFSGGNLFYSHCASHVLNAMAQDALNTITDIAMNLRDMVKYVTSPVRCQKFQEVVEHVGLSNVIPLCLDVSTRWDSTYIMLDRVLHYKEAFSVYVVRDPNLTCTPSAEDWNRLELIHKFLKSFYDVASVLFGSKSLTANMHFHELWKIKMLLDEESLKPHTYTATTISNMQMKFNDYWKECNLFLTIPVIFDPRFKLKFLEYCFAVSYGSRAQPLILNLEQVTRQLFLEYQTYFPSNEEASASVAKDAYIKNETGNFDILKGWNQFLCQQARSNAHTELDQYLQESVFSGQDHFDVLNWWSANSTMYPTLSHMARHLLAFPASAISLETAFSIGSRNLAGHLGSLNCNSVEAVICLQDWLQRTSDGT